LHVGVDEGEEEMVKNNHFIDEFILKEFEPTSKGQLRIAVSFEIDGNGGLSVSATDRKSKTKMFLKIDSDANCLSGETGRWANEVELERKASQSDESKNDLEKYLRNWNKRLTYASVEAIAWE
jgi:molecular chaperone DnaK (HSP70)